MAIRERASRRLLELHHRGTRPALSLILQFAAESRGSGLVSAGASLLCYRHARKGLLVGADAALPADGPEITSAFGPVCFSSWLCPWTIFARQNFGPGLARRLIGLAKPWRRSEWSCCPRQALLSQSPLQDAHFGALQYGRHLWGRLADNGDNDTFFFDDDDADSDESPKIDAQGIVRTW